MISKKSLVAVLDKSIILTITSPNDNANQDPVQCAPALSFKLYQSKSKSKSIVSFISKDVLGLEKNLLSHHIS